MIGIVVLVGVLACLGVYLGTLLALELEGLDRLELMRCVAVLSLAWASVGALAAGALA